MDSAQIERNMQELVRDFSRERFVFDLLLAYGLPKATITLLQKGRHNLSKEEHRIILKKKLFFQEVSPDEDLHTMIDRLQKDDQTMRHSPRFIIVTNYQTLLAVDTKTHEQLDTPINGLARHYDFFLPWAGIEKHRHQSEHPADRKAAEKMAKLYDGIRAENDIDDEQRTHDLNVFLSRLLFCFFAEDTGIFAQSLFIDSVASHTQTDGSDLSLYLERLFVVLNTEESHRPANLPEHLQHFPYVNGGLFRKTHWIPQFSAKSHRIIIECGELDWKEINPDIFGSMMQAVTHPGQRASLGMHYTSVPNIMKVIEPLFLDELKEEFEKQRGNKKKLGQLLMRIARIKLFDPACGSGNFLIIAYKELRRLQMAILEEMSVMAYPRINLSNFYGIEIDDFAHTIARLSLYLAEHQMNIEFKAIFGQVEPTLPLKDSGHIVCGNATRTDWETVCPKHEGDETYILGNPPYLGARMQNKEQKGDMCLSVGHIHGFNNLDYIAPWFYKAAKYIRGANAQFAFVSTNSISQGSQVSLLWPELFRENVEIHFAYQSFKWTNSAKGNAGVTCVIVGMRNVDSSQSKHLFKGGFAQHTDTINGYLLNAPSIFIQERREPISRIPAMRFGSMPNDGGHLLLSKHEYEEARKRCPEILPFVRKAMGGQEFLKGIERYALWIDESEKERALEIPFISDRVQSVKAYREKSDREATRKLAAAPHRFGEVRHKETEAILVPRISSERREYIPIGFLDSDTILTDLTFVIYDAEPWIFGIISSRMHMTWVRAVAGRLKTDYRYSSALCYNTFPIPTLTAKQKEEITRHVYDVLEEREKHSEKTMAQLYDPEKMPQGLKEAHHSLDAAVERIYRSRPFTSDEERLEYLFDLYSRMIGEEN